MAARKNTWFSIFSSCIIVLMILSTFNTEFTHALTQPSDIEALRSIKLAIDPSSIPTSSYLHSWDFTEDPCESSKKFIGIVCSFPIDGSNATSRITLIELDSAKYDGFLSSSVGNLTSLTSLTLDKNQFRGPVPDTLANLRQLTKLSIGGNFFTGPIPISLTRLRDLVILDLSQNRLSGSIPSKIARLRKLNQLSLSNNLLAGRIPDLAGLWQLKVLEVSSNQLYGSLPSLPLSLTSLALSHNALSGHISSIKKLQKLRTLELGGNRFSGTITADFLTFPEIVLVNMSSNQFTQINVIKYSGRDSHLRTLDVGKNLLQGRLPMNLVTYQNLVEINLGYNRFHGLIPKIYGSKIVTSWKSLYLDNNYLTGDIPPQFLTNASRIKGSLAENCLKCPKTNQLCQGGQKSPSECAR